MKERSESDQEELMGGFAASEVVTSQRILYTPSAFAKNSLVFLQEIGTLQARKQHISRRSNLDSYLFFRVLSGAGTLHYNGERYELKEGDCVFIDCNRPYAHETDGEKLWTLSWIHFSGIIMPDVFGKYLSRGGQPVFQPYYSRELNQLLEDLYAVAGSDDPVRDMRINELLCSLLTVFMREAWGRAEDSGAGSKRDVSEVRKYLEEHYRRKISLDELAEHFYINKFYLTRIFKEQFGVSINAYLLGIRINHAKHMLRFTDEKIENIGLECGLGAANYFSRTFKNVEGISPSQYREKW